MTEKYETLHCHTLRSDGKLTHLQILDLFARKNIGVVAFTDHDCLPKQEDMEILQNHADHVTKWIVGCELSSGWPKEMGGIGGDFHIVGLFTDPFNKELKQRNKAVRQERQRRMERIVSKLNDLGFILTSEDCLEASGGEGVSRPHVVMAMTKYPKNNVLLEEYRQQMEQEAKKDPTVKEQFEAMMLRGERQYPYALLLGQDPFIKGVNVSYDYFTDLDESVRLVRRAGGVAILAHWSFIKKDFPLDRVEGLLRDKRLDGVEVIYGLGVTDKQEEFLEDQKDLARLAEKYQALQSGGVDLHEAADADYFIDRPEYAQRTIGLTKHLVQDSRVNPHWSSLSL